MRVREFASIVVALALWLAGSAAQAQSEGEAPASTPDDSSGARALFVEGQQAYDSGQYEVSIERWEAAYRLDARAPLLFNLAQAHGRLGHVEEEADYLRRFLEAVGTEHPLSAGARSRLDALEQRVARTALVVEGGIPGSAVLVDGAARGTLPLEGPLQVEPGRHELEVRRDGYHPFTATLDVRAGRQSTVTVEQLEEVEIVVREHANLRTPGLALAIGGGALAGIGVVTGGLALGASDGAVDGSSDADRARTLALITDLAVPIGIVAAGAGVVLLLVDKSHDSSDGVSFEPWIGPEIAGGRVVGSF